MKKIILIVTLCITLSANSSYAVGFAIPGGVRPVVQKEVKLASKSAVISKIQANISQDLMQRAQKEITRRLDFLNDLITKLNGIKKITSAGKADLQSQIQAQIDSLNTLQTKINNDTDNVTLKADVKSIVSDYYIFLFFRVKVNLLIASDRASSATDNLNQIYTKLQTRINQDQTPGEIASLNSLLSDMNAKLTDANTENTAVQTELTPLVAQGYPGNKTTLDDASVKIKTAISDLKAVYQDALQIRQGLKGLKITNPEASSSAQ